MKALGSYLMFLFLLSQAVFGIDDLQAPAAPLGENFIEKVNQRQKELQEWRGSHQVVLGAHAEGFVSLVPVPATHFADQIEDLPIKLEIFPKMTLPVNSETRQEKKARKEGRTSTSKGSSGRGPSTIYTAGAAKVPVLLLAMRYSESGAFYSDHGFKMDRSPNNSNNAENQEIFALIPVVYTDVHGTNHKVLWSPFVFPKDQEFAIKYRFLGFSNPIGGLEADTSDFVSQRSFRLSATQNKYKNPLPSPFDYNLGSTPYESWDEPMKFFGLESGSNQKVIAQFLSSWLERPVIGLLSKPNSAHGRAHEKFVNFLANFRSRAAFSVKPALHDLSFRNIPGLPNVPEGSNSRFIGANVKFSFVIEGDHGNPEEAANSPLKNWVDEVANPKDRSSIILDRFGIPMNLENNRTSLAQKDASTTSNPQMPTHDRDLASKAGTMASAGPSCSSL